MPRKVRELIADLKRAGFVNRGGKGDDRNFVHPKVTKPVTLSGAGHPSLRGRDAAAFGDFRTE
jgi:predicted RNA binding protein YcfA (HicA-like mRNA interferase family)